MILAAIAVGVLAGILTGIPTAFLLLAVLENQRQARPTPGGWVVVDGGTEGRYEIQTW